jgi:hypothetical protein
MFSFLNSTVLFAAAAALIPLIIHLFSRRKVKVVEFSSIRHLKEMQRRQLRRLKIRQLLLLMLRMLIILMVVLAFARPTVREGSIGTHASVAAVILLDNSASMNRFVIDGNLFEVARKRTTELLGTFSQSDQVSLLPLDPSRDAGSDAFTTAAVALEKLSRISPGAARADIQTQLSKATDLLASATSLNREIYIVTDRQRSSLPQVDLLRDSKVNLYLVDLPLEDNDDLGVVALDLGGQLIQAGHDFDVVATIRNFGSRGSEQRIASLYLDGQHVAQSEFSVAPGAETTVRFTRSVSSTGFHSGFVEISDDNFPADNRQYFSFRIPDQFNLLVIDGDPVTQFLTLALVPEGAGGQYWSVKRAAPEDLAGVDFRDYDVVVLAGAPRLAESYVSRLKSFVNSGKAVFITYGERTDIDYFNRTWSDMTGVTYDQPVRKDFSRAGYYSFKSFNLDHPIFSVFAFEGGKPPEVKFYSLPELHVSKDARVLAVFTGDRPALVETTSGSGKVLTFTGPMALEYTDLASLGFFVPFVSRISEYLAADLTSLDVKLYAGQNISRALLQTSSAGNPVDMIAPDSTLSIVPPEEDKGSLVVRTGPLAQAGIYRLRQLGREIDRFAVNIDPAECDLAAADADQFALSLGTDKYRELSADTPLARVISEYRVGRELWQVFLWVALALLALEMLLGRRAPSED